MSTLSAKNRFDPDPRVIAGSIDTKGSNNQLMGSFDPRQVES